MTTFQRLFFILILLFTVSENIAFAGVERDEALVAIEFDSSNGKILNLNLKSLQLKFNCIDFWLNGAKLVDELASAPKLCEEIIKEIKSGRNILSELRILKAFISVNSAAIMAASPEQTFNPPTNLILEPNIDFGASDIDVGQFSFQKFDIYPLTEKELSIAKSRYLAFVHTSCAAFTEKTKDKFSPQLTLQQFESFCDRVEGTTSSIETKASALQNEALKTMKSELAQFIKARFIEELYPFFKNEFSRLASGQPYLTRIRSLESFYSEILPALNYSIKKGQDAINNATLKKKEFNFETKVEQIKTDINAVRISLEVLEFLKPNFNHMKLAQYFASDLKDPNSKKVFENMLSKELKKQLIVGLGNGAFSLASLIMCLIPAGRGFKMAYTTVKLFLNSGRTYICSTAVNVVFSSYLAFSQYETYRHTANLFYVNDYAGKFAQFNELTKSQNAFLLAAFLSVPSVFLLRQAISESVLFSEALKIKILDKINF